MSFVKPKKQVPYSYVLDELSSLDLHTNPMFGCTAVYVGPKIMLVLRKKAEMDLDTGIWVCIPDEFVVEMKKMFPILKGVTFFNNENSAWQNIRETEPDFEEVSLEICKLIKKGDPRIGRVPKPKKLKTKKATPKKVSAPRKIAKKKTKKKN